MSDDTVAQGATEATPVVASLPVEEGSNATTDAKEAGNAVPVSNGVTEEAKDAPETGAPGTETAPAVTASEEPTSEATSATEQLVAAEMATSEPDKNTSAPAEIPVATEESGASETPQSAIKSKARRKSSGVAEHKSRKLNKKASKVKLLHVDAKPGDHYYIRLKGYPLWPGIICAEDMLPKTLLDARPVTAANSNGEYREDFQEGGRRVGDRSFPVMYLYTNEFGWIPNYDLVDLDLETVGQVPETLRKDLYQAHQLAAEKHDLDFYRQVLQEFQEQQLAEAEAKKEAQAAKAAAKGKGKRKSAVTVTDEEAGGEDVEMADITADVAEGGQPKERSKASKKRKATADAENDTAGTPQRSESVKKPKIKLNATPKPSNGSDTPKSTTKKEAKPKKPKKAATNGEAAPPTPKEPEPSPEERRLKKEKEILFLRHKLQKGLLTRDQEPKASEMKAMSEYVTKLEGHADLEVSIIRATKINKVLKAILKLDEIPKESEFHFKNRSQALLEQWNKVLESAAPPVAPTPVPLNTEEAAPKELTNGSAKVEDGNAIVDASREKLATEAQEDVPMEDTPKEDAPKDTPSVEIAEPPAEPAEPKLESPAPAATVEADA